MSSPDVNERFMVDKLMKPEDVSELITQAHVDAASMRAKRIQAKKERRKLRHNLQKEAHKYACKRIGMFATNRQIKAAAKQLTDSALAKARPIKLPAAQEEQPSLRSQALLNMFNDPAIFNRLVDAR